MNISYLVNHSMTQFHENENIQKLVYLCVKYYHTSIFEDIIALIVLPNKESVIRYLNEIEKHYGNNQYLDVFFIYNSIILNLFDDSRIKNLKGAFLEVLSIKLFENIYHPQNVYSDCNICIDDWKSRLTVDIAMECYNNALACECKVPVSKFNWNILNNLLEIKYKSKNYFTVCAITLNTQESMNMKKQRIMNAVSQSENLNEIHFIAREDLFQFAI